MVYRDGPDPERDVVLFCGPGNVGQMIDGNLMGHYWLEHGRDIIDFSAGDWRGDIIPELEINLDPDDPSDLGPIQWDLLSHLIISGCARKRLSRSEVSPRHPWVELITPAGRDHCRAFGVRRWKKLKAHFFWIRKRWRRISGCTAKTMI